MTRHDSDAGNAGDAPAGLMALGESFPAVLEAAREGADWAWRVLFNEFAGPVLRYVRSRGAAEPEDVTGEVLLQIARDLVRFQGTESEFRSWVFVVAHHRLLDERRYRRRHPAEPAASDRLAGLGASGDVEEEAMRSLATRRVVVLLGGMPKAQREVLLLRMVAGLSVEETARTLGRTPNAVKALQRRGLAGVRNKLAREATPPGGMRR